DARSLDPLLTAWVQAAGEAGIASNPDFNGAVQDGVGVYQVTQRDGLRCSSARAFLRGGAQQPSLTILHSTLALRIVWERDRAVGLEVDHDGEVRTSAVGEELSGSAGAYQSPHLLLL